VTRTVPATPHRPAFRPAYRSFSRLIFSLALTVAALAATSAEASLLSDWNLLVKNNLNTNSHVDGSAKVGGNVTGGASVFSMHLVTDPDGAGLVVGGNIAVSNLQINSGGDLRIGGTTSGTVLYNGGGVKIPDSGAAAEVASDFAYLYNLSNDVAAMAPNSTFSKSGNSGTFNATPTNIAGQLVAVFNIDGDAMNGLGQVQLNFNTAQTVIINMKSVGGNVTFNAPPNMIGGFGQGNSTRILWNLYDAETVSVNNSFSGALLAPWADLAVNGPGMYGTVAVESISNQNAEIRKNLYTGYLPPVPVPEPSTAVLAVSGLALLGLAIRRRR
jgi:choice-of-anchor A domain-containing protein